MRTILLKFAAPIQSWGTTPYFETRETDRYPSKSAVIGMIAAALGYRRDEDEKLKPLQDLSFATRVDQTGGLLRDFQVAMQHEMNGDLNRSPKKGTYVVDRYYLQDAIFVVALSSPDDELMEHIGQALRAPYFPLYLGRRSAPINPDYWLGMNEKGIMANLKDTKWQAGWNYQRRHPQSRDVWADSDLIGHQDQLTKDVPESFAQYATDSPYNHTDRRGYRLRSVGHTTVDVISDVK